MAFDHQIRGLLLEESILALLRAAGYKTITEPGGDPTLSDGPAGLVVAGRGTGHQIDAIADFRVAQPFSNPQRLLVEAKYYAEHRPVSLPVVRNSVGVLKDVSEVWFGAGGNEPAARRYHYQSAVFSASAFTEDAQNYAYAHDIYLLPLRESSYFVPVLAAIGESVAELPQSAHRQVIGVELSALRREIRRRLQPDIMVAFAEAIAADQQFEWLDPVINASLSIRLALVGMIARAFPVLLVPRPGLALEQLQDVTQVEIHFQQDTGVKAWTLTHAGDQTPLFTFDLPEQIFRHYAIDGVLSPDRAVDMKAGYLREIQAIYAPAEHMRLLTFRLDPDWLRRLWEFFGT